MSNTQETEDCAICLCPLSESPTLTLSCNHVFHLSCLRLQLEHTVPSPSQPLLFSGTRCALCKQPAHHPSLTLPSSRLRLESQVDTLIYQQALVDPPPEDEDILVWGRRVFAFFVCSACGDAYFGGRLACAHAHDEELANSDRLCDKCSTRTGARCNNGTHANSYIWKCRFCCKVADYVCYGGVHMCADCHEMDDGHGGGVEVKECVGQGCPLGGLEEGEKHVNRKDVSGELLLKCGICATGGATRAIGGSNCVQNESGDDGLSYWLSLGARMWTVETIGNRKNFVSSFMWSVMGQVVDLGQWVDNLEMPIRVEIAASVMCRTDCPAVFRLIGREVGGRGSWDSGTIEAEAAGWAHIEGVIEEVRSRYVLVVIAGKDGRCWSGDYGSKCRDVSVRVLGGGVGQPGTSVPHGVIQRAMSEYMATCVPRMRYGHILSRFQI